MEDLYRRDPKDVGTIKGLLVVSESTADKEGIRRYSGELVAVQDSVENRIIQVQTFLKTDLLEDAKHKLASLKEKYPDEPRALLLEAWLAMRQGQLKEALDLTNRNLQGGQDSASAWRLRGEINYLMADYEQAISDLKKSKTLSDEPSTRISLTRAYLRAGRFEDAVTEIKGLVDDPRFVMQAGELLEQIYARAGKKQELVAFYDDMLQRFPSSLMWYKRAAAFALGEGQLQKAERLYKEGWLASTQSGKNDLELFDGYLRALVAGKKFEQVFAQASAFSEGDPLAISFYWMAEARIELGNKEDAVRYCRKAIDSAGGNVALVAEMVRRMAALVGMQEAIGYCQSALESRPDSLSANYAMFTLATSGAEYNKAIGFIDRCIEIEGPGGKRTIDYIAQKTQVLQQAYVKTSDNSYLRSAITEYKSLLDKMPNNTDVLNNLAYLLAESNEGLDEALALAKRAYQAMPTNPNVLDTYSYVLYRRSEFAQAAEFVLDALQRYEKEDISAPPEVYEHLGMIKEKLGAGQEALAAYKQALAGGEGSLPEAQRRRIEAAVERLSK